MSIVNCSFSQYENLLDIGAIMVEKDSIDFCLKFCSFFHCTRSHRCGGAVFVNSTNGNAKFLRSCFSWCSTNTQNIVDQGQAVYSEIDNGFTTFSECICMFCAVEDSVWRHGDLTTNFGELYCTKINASNSFCQWSAAVLAMHTTKGFVSESTLINMTSLDQCDTVGFRSVSGSAEISRIVYLSCRNPEFGVPIKNSTCEVDIHDCIIYDCPNFNKSYYLTNRNEFISSAEVPSLRINKDLCLGKFLFQTRHKSNRPRLNMLASLMLT